MRSWSKEEFETVLRCHAAGWKSEQISKVINRTPASIRLKLISKGYSSETVKLPPHPEIPEPSRSPLSSVVPTPSAAQIPDEDVAFTKNHAEQLLEARELQMQGRLDRQRAIEEAQRERLLKIFGDTLREGQFNVTVNPPQIPSELDTPHSVVLALGDYHMGKVCSPAETEGRANYNPAVAIARTALLEQEVAKHIASGPPVDELVILLCGDIVEGALDHCAEREETILLSKQYALAVTIFAQLILRLASTAPKLKIYGVAGNHGRWPNQRKMPTSGRESNFDGLVYSAIQMVINAAGATSISFDLRESSRQLINVKNTKILLAHGDQLRGGEYYVAGIKREVYNSVLRYGEQGEIPNLWVTGDKHISVNLPVGNGQFLINGSFVGEDSFSQRFAPAIPSQTLFWVCPRRGKTLQADIRLDRAVLSPVIPYQLSAHLEALVKSYHPSNLI